jgi:hypothetical protein
MVLRVDKEKGYIDLSKRRVSPEDIAACEERFTRSKLVHGIVGHVAETCGVEVEELYQQVAWPLYKMYGHAFEAFKARARAACPRRCARGRPVLLRQREAGRPAASRGTCRRARRVRARVRGVQGARGRPARAAAPEGGRRGCCQQRRSPLGTA